MELLQMDIVGGIKLAEEGEPKVVTGVDDHSRFCVIATVVVCRATGRTVCLPTSEPGTAIEVDRLFSPIGVIGLAGRQHPVGYHFAGRRSPSASTAASCSSSTRASYCAACPTLSPRRTGPDT